MTIENTSNDFTGPEILKIPEGAFKLIADAMGLEAARNVALKDALWENRSLDQYMHFLGFEREDLAGKRVLDIGSGTLRLFATEASQLGADVVSLDPMILTEKWEREFDDDDQLKLERERAIADKESGKLVKAIAQDMPFESSSFDIIVALFSVPAYLPRLGGEVAQTFDEILRVIKPGGRAYIYPVCTKAKYAGAGYTYVPEGIVRMIEEASGHPIRPKIIERSRHPDFGETIRERMVIKK